jgi:hypothetical protein
MALLLSGVLHAQDGVRTTYSGSVGFFNPCNNVLVVVTGTNYVRIDDDTQQKSHGHDRDGRGHVNVELKFVGYGKDDNGNPYRAVLIAHGQSDSASTMYDMQFHSMFVGIKGAPSFAVDGSIRVFAQGETATGSEITSFDTSCRAGDHEADGDHDDSH